MRTAPAALVLLTALQGTPQRDTGDWPMPGKDFASTRYSGLSQITAANAHQLRAVWSFSTGVLGGHEGQPLVVNNTMYVVTPFPNVLYAFDLRREGYPLKWKYRPDVNPSAVGMACCDAINRGAVYAAGKIVYNLLDGHTVAVDANTGRELWKTQIADLGQGETTPMAPFVAGNRVIVGPSGGEFGIYGWVKGLDLATGKIAWTAHNMGPDSLMLATAAFLGDRNIGLTTWTGDAWRRGGAPVWGWISYDPALDLIYFGVGNPSPYNNEQRPGENKWTNSVLARRPGDGTLVWGYQFTPHDSWDYDANAEMILVDLVVGGRLRKVLVHFDKNGFAYTLDRTTGELLVAEPFAHVTWAKGIDRSSGLPIVDSSKVTGASRGNIKGICPSLEGGKSPASPSSYSPRTGLFYTATNNLCMSFEAVPVTRIPGTPFIGASTPYTAGPGGHMGAFIAWDAARGRKVWEIKEKFPVWSGSVVTAGDVVFYGTLDGWFKAANARTGRELWKFKVGSGVVGAPISFRGADGKQYIAVYAGIGGDWFLLSGDVRSDDPADVRPPADFAPDLARYTSQGGIVWIFGL
ncbi:MAG: PQQ-dependent dehydrogenase, methanol/ethanol family [Gemmatimonadales bacterium]